MFLASIYLLKINDRNCRTRCKICIKLTIKTRVVLVSLFSRVFIVNYEQFSHLVLVLVLLTLSRKMPTWVRSKIWRRSITLNIVTRNGQSGNTGFMSILQSSRLVSQVHMMAGQSVKKKYLMCQIQMKMLKQHAITNSEFT